MRLWNRDPDILQFGQIVHKVRPRKTKVTFLVKGTFRLVPDGVVEPLAPRDPELPDVIWLTLGPGDLEKRPDLPLGDQPLGEPAPLGALPADLNRYESDFAPFKPRADILVAASAHAPGGAPARHLDVGIKIGPVAKSLRVVGDYGLINGKPTEVAPFTSMPVTYDRAYGGPGFPRNPAGRGHATDGDEHGCEVRPMHNIQRPRDTVDVDREPAGFGPLPRSWPQRGNGGRGTFDGAWQETSWPWFPDDFVWSHFNAAPTDQQVDGYLRGDEAMEFKNLHPDHPVLRSKLPGLRVRMFFKDLVTSPVDEAKPEPPPPKAKPAAAEPPPSPLPPSPPDMLLPDGSVAMPTPLDFAKALKPETDALEKAMATDFAPFQRKRPPDPPFRWREVPLVLDTLFVDVEAGKVNLVWRGVATMRTQKLREVGDLFFLAEPLSEPEHPPKHYLTLLEARRETVFAAFDPPPGTPSPDNLHERIKVKTDAAKSLLDKAKALGEREKARYAAFAEKEAASLGDKSEPRPPPVPLPKANTPQGGTMDRSTPPRMAPSIPTYAALSEKAQRDKLAELEASDPALAVRFKAQVAFAASGAPFERNPELLAAEAERAKAEARIEAGKRQINETIAAALRPLIGDAPVTGLTFQDRGAFLDAARAGQDLRRASFLEVDLSGLDLSGLELSGASFLACAFRGSSFNGARLAKASVLGGVFEDVEMKGAVLDNWSMLDCRFERVRFNGASIASANFCNHDFPGCDFAGVTGEAALFINAGLDGVAFTGARLAKGFFHGARLRGADFTGAFMEKGHFGAVKAERIVMRDARIDGFRAIEGADFRDGDFRAIRAVRSNWEQAKLMGADFSGAILTDSILNEVRAADALFDRAHLERVWFEEADLKRARLTNADLLRANFERADLTECDLSHSNLFEAWMIDAIFQNTAIHDSLRKRTLIERMMTTPEARA